MDLSSLKNALEVSDQQNERRQTFINGLLRLADHWDGERGQRYITNEIYSLIRMGMTDEEALIEGYRIVKSKIF